MLTPEQLEHVKRTIWSQLGEVHTTLPGTVISYDSNSGRAVVRPALSKQLANGAVLESPQIVDVVVCWPVADGGSAFVALPLKPGDSVMLSFSERALDTWLEDGDSTPWDPRMFDLTDAFASPTVDYRPIGADGARLHIQYGEASMLFSKDGRIEINADVTLNGNEVHNGNIERNGDTALKGAATSNGKNISDSHTHSGVESGNSNTGGVT